MQHHIWLLLSCNGSRKSFCDSIFFNSQLRALILSSFLLLFFSTSLLLYLYIKFCEYPTIQWRIVAWKLKNIVCSCKRKADIDKLNPSSTSCFQTLWYEIVVHSLWAEWSKCYFESLSHTSLSVLFCLQRKNTTSRFAFKKLKCKSMLLGG